MASSNPSPGGPRRVMTGTGEIDHRENSQKTKYYNNIEGPFKLYGLKDFISSE